MKALPLPDQSELLSKFIYCKDTGELRLARNNRIVGHKHTTRRGHGFVQISIYGRRVLAHRVIWKMVTGKDPVNEIDHINGNPFDNRWENLRDVSTKDNCRNRKRPSNNTSGCTGVYWLKKIKKWQARITINDKTKSLGNYSNKHDAIAVRKAAEKTLGFHENHDRKNNPK